MSRSRDFAAAYAIKGVAGLVIERMLGERDDFLETTRCTPEIAGCLVGAAQFVHGVGPGPRALAELEETGHRVRRLLFEVQIAEQPMGHEPRILFLLVGELLGLVLTDPLEELDRLGDLAP